MELMEPLCFKDLGCSEFEIGEVVSLLDVLDFVCNTGNVSNPVMAGRQA